MVLQLTLLLSCVLVRDLSSVVLVTSGPVLNGREDFAGAPLHNVKDDIPYSSAKPMSFGMSPPAMAWIIV